jgi:mono/diheme cytochrome c family protein
VVPQSSRPEYITLSGGTAVLLDALHNPNGWVRNKAQQSIIDEKLFETVPALRKNLQRIDSALLVVHSLWTLEGLGRLESNDVLPLLEQNNQMIKVQALSVIPSVVNKINAGKFLVAFQKMIRQSDEQSAPYIGFLLPIVRRFDPVRARQILKSLIIKFGSDKYVAAAIISNLQNREREFYRESLETNPDTTRAVNTQLKNLIGELEKAKNNSNAARLAAEYPRGAFIFNTVCQTCHGSDGNGVSSLAPPLNNSNWVKGDKTKLIPIVLYGLSGAVEVGGKVYQVPEINGEMPGIGQNKDYSDEDISQILNYVRNSWSNKAEKISAADIQKIRTTFKDRQKPFTMAELNGLK